VSLHVTAQAAFQSEREDLLEDYRALTQQIKLKNLIIACFIPPQYQVIDCV
jgi:kinesin family protein 3/17